MTEHTLAAAPRSKRDRGPEAQRATMKARRDQFLQLYDFSQGRGLEIGPLDAGIADTECHDVRYVDIFDTAGIVEHYAEDPNVILELVPHIDYPIYVDGQARPLGEAAAPGGPYDWVIASHVIEHVPDVIGWLEQIADISADGARLLLAVPDRRYCFDRHRPPTTIGQALDAYEEQRTRPTPGTVYDFFSTVVSVNTAELWSGGRPPGRSARIHDLNSVRSQVEQARAGEYIDCHVWTFTPEALLEQVQELRELGLCEWYVEHVEPSRGTVEFLAVLRRLPRDGDRSVPAEPTVSDDVPSWLADEVQARDRLRKVRGSLQAERQRVRVLRRRNQRLRARLAEVDVPVAARVRGAVARRLRARRG
ncbi:methyltransferase domain-containing protein [Nocardioides pantholopis]|uniref:methyltransferase domain-containing protein n=1 Tax=Nocardioides pantholopis TaxID=2483798 RepID=UPI000FD6E17A|nr:methyltransferase domain-containing protein [Nocardioides pantholopis]